MVHRRDPEPGCSGTFRDGGADDGSVPGTASAPSVSLPKGGGAIKGIDEKFHVNSANGTAGLRIPLPFSPARDAAPSLHLRYDSGAGNGVFGLGWTIDLPSIKRRTDAALPQYGEADAFLLSDTDDLVPALEPGTDGQWHPIAFDSPCGRFRIRPYRPRVDTAFSRIECWTAKADGEVRWRVITRDNRSTLFGWSAASRIADPADPRRIYQWLPEFSFDDRGNCARYEYGGEDADDLDPACLHDCNRRRDGTLRFTQRTLERVLYGNKTPYGGFGHAVPPDSDFLFSTVFDHGDHEVEPPCARRGRRRLRLDAHSDYKPGFEVRTTRLCQRVLLYHHADALPGGSALVKSLDFGHSDAAESGFSYLVSITERGYVKQADGRYTQRALPPLEFEYRQEAWSAEVRAIPQSELAHRPPGPNAQRQQFVDLYNEGLAGLLTETGDGWTYQRNLGQGRFAPGEPVARKPSFAGIGAGLQVVDLAGDGRKQLVSLRDEPRGYFELDGGEQRFRSFQGLPNVDLQATHVHLIDLNGDGRPELLVAEESVFTWYEFTGSHGFVAARSVPRAFDEESGPQLVFADRAQTIFLADMSGDGLTDIVRVRNGEVCYWPNLGYGRFGAKVSMDGAPLFDHPGAFNPARLRLADIDGSGTADIVYLGREQFRCWKNLGGNRFGATPFVIDAVPGLHDQAQVSVMDLLGDGVACIVWSSGQAQDADGPLKYIDLMRGRKPHLLTGYRNNLGKEVRLDYTPSTRFYLEDRAAGRPWAGGLHFPVHCLSMLETRDRVSGHRFVSSYRYHDGHYDAADREFRGFGLVEQTDTEAFEHWVQGEGRHLVDHGLHQPPAITRQWFHTGQGGPAGPGARDGWQAALARQGFPVADPELPRQALQLQVAPGLDPALAEGLGSAERREAVRACKGRRLRSEVLAQDAPLVGATAAQRLRQGVPYSVEVSPCVVLLLQPRGPNRHAVFTVQDGETLAYAYERDPEDPRITHRLNLAFDEQANVLLSAEVAYPRRRPDPSLPAATQQDQARAAVVVTRRRHTDDACGLHHHRLRLPSEEEVFELPGLALPASGCSVAWLRAAWLDAERPRRLLAHRRHTFCDGTLARPLPLHRLGVRALPCETHELAFTAALLHEVFGGRVDDLALLEGGYVSDARGQGDARWWVRTAAQRYLLEGEDAAAAHARFCVPVAQADAHGAWSRLEHGPHALYLASVEDAAGNRTRVERFDWRTLSPTRLKDANDNLSEVRLDELGRVKALAVFGKGDEADDLDGLDDATGADEAAQVDAFFAAPDGAALGGAARALLRHASARFVHDEAAYRRCGTPAAVASIVRERHHREGEGSPLQISLEYSSGLGRVLMKKAQAAPGRARRVVLLPDDRYAVSEVDTAACQPPQPRWIGSGRSVLDNKGCTVKQYEPYFSATHRYEDLKELVETGVTPLMHHDALGRCVRTDLPDGSCTRTEFGAWHETRHDGCDTDPHSPHAGTPERRCVDPQGRTVMGIVHQREGGADMLYTTRFELDVQGRLLSLTDANGHTVLRYRHCLRGHELMQDSADAGRRWLLPDVLGNALRAWDERGHVIVYRHDDPLHRLTQVRVQGGDGAVPLDHVVERRCYGEAEPGAAARNLRGRLVRHYDGAGLLQTLACDLDGRPTATVRRLLRDHRGIADWSDSRLQTGLDDVAYAFLTQTDALGRTARRTLPDGRVVRWSYDAGGLLRALAVDGTVHVAHIAYNAKGQRERLVYGNGVITTFEYDPRTFRLARLSTRRRDGRALQDWRYTHDAVGNLTRAEDRCAPTTFFGHPEVDAATTYAYDALYRLTEATGREHAAAPHPGDGSAWSDARWRRALAPGDPLAMRRYRQQFRYDRAGNLLSLRHQAEGGDWARHYRYQPGSNRLLETRVGARVEAYPHQRQGAMTALPHLQRLDWSFDERLVCSARQRRHDGGTPETTWYQYDAEGRRVRKVTERGAGPGRAPVVKDERVVLEGFEVYRRHAGRFAGLVRTSLGLMDGEHRFATVDTRNEVDDGSPALLVRYQLHNHQGSACLELDGSPEARVISCEEYHPYGTTACQARSRAVRAAARRWRFTGMERDEESGLQCHGARYYAPWLGRWISADPRLREGVSKAAPPAQAPPSGTPERPPPGAPAHEPSCIRRSPGQDGASDPRDLNPYAYASQNPLLYRDPSGEVPILQAWYDGYKNASSEGKWGYGFLFVFAWLAHVIVNLVVLALSVTVFNLGGLFGALDFTWAAPQSVLGLLAGTVLTLLGADVSPQWGMGAKVEMPAYMGNPGGMSLGPTVIAGHGFSDFSHEFGHTWQSRVLGPLYLLIIGIPSLISAASDPTNHRGFFSEKWADAWGI